MAVYRYQVVCVGWWRGKIKRWNTTFHRSSPDFTADLQLRMSRAGYPNPGDALGACSGGVASIACYASTGGAPLSNTVYFDWQTPSEWIPYTGDYWTGIPAGTPLDASGESALLLTGLLPGLSSTGKPVEVRKYLHAIPSRTAAAYSEPDVPAAVQAQFVAGFPTSVLLSPSGVAPVATECQPYYGNHQRVRGRRRTTTQVAAQAFSGGVVMGTSACASGGGGRPAQFQ